MNTFCLNKCRRVEAEGVFLLKCVTFWLFQTSFFGGRTARPAFSSIQKVVNRLNQGYDRNIAGMIQMIGTVAKARWLGGGYNREHAA